MITGVAGVLGSALAEKMLEDGHTIVGLDNFSTGQYTNINKITENPNFSLLVGTILDEELVYTGMSGCNAVVHLAARTSVPLSFKYEEQFFETNVYGTHVVVDTAVKLGIPKFILASSTAVYGNINTPMLETEKNLKPASPYAVGKIAAEKILLSSKIKEPIVLRFNDLFGPRQEKMKEAKPVVMRFIETAMSNGKFTIHGDGMQERMFTHVFNAVHAIKLAVENENVLNCTPIFNVGEGEPETLLNVYCLLCSIFGKFFDMETTHVFRQGDVKSIYAPYDKIADILNYCPVINFEDGVVQTIQYLQNIEVWN